MTDQKHSNSDQEAFVQLFTQYERNVRAYVASLLPNWEGVDEVMQASSLVMWRKFDQFDANRPDSSFLSWAFIIARYEVLKYRRKRATDRLVFSEDVFELLATESEKICSGQSAREEALRRCVKKLEPVQQELVNTVYSEGVSIKAAATLAGRTPTGVYKALARVRKNLQRCVRLTVSEEHLRELA
ncbi:sigma-70 family RNA polymerase sigma factor [Pontiella sulfatireligans]|uniref:Uncharacterized protein n=1 Tax=Pontiella sulfatireligans TaxID=2750658 RepID=A0A6C2UF59_9BACT|nr:sigma-70 family RNA polymerase sigma factor [Pontiella sulfatireligans]VGO18559.1 hypothetical protein SCARR_00612 [Pontiella sulfatireligans]